MRTAKEVEQAERIRELETFIEGIEDYEALENKKVDLYGILLDSFIEILKQHGITEVSILNEFTRSVEKQCQQAPPDVKEESLTYPDHDKNCASQSFGEYFVCNCQQALTPTEVMEISEDLQELLDNTRPVDVCLKELEDDKEELCPKCGSVIIFSNWFVGKNRKKICCNQYCNYSKKIKEV